MGDITVLLRCNQGRKKPAWVDADRETSEQGVLGSQPVALQPVLCPCQGFTPAQQHPRDTAPGQAWCGLGWGCVQLSDAATGTNPAWLGS